MNDKYINILFQTIDFFICSKAEGWAERGCTVDAEIDESTDDIKGTDNLITCSDFNGCNSANVLNSYCIQCDSNDDPACKTNPNPDNVQECISPSKCYHFIHPTTGRTLRGNQTNQFNNVQQLLYK